MLVDVIVTSVHELQLYFLSLEATNLGILSKLAR